MPRNCWGLARVFGGLGLDGFCCGDRLWDWLSVSVEMSV
jgi:hypothetical protein